MQPTFIVKGLFCLCFACSNATAIQSRHTVGKYLHVYGVTKFTAEALFASFSSLSQQLSWVYVFRALSTQSAPRKAVELAWYMYVRQI